MKKERILDRIKVNSVVTVMLVAVPPRGDQVVRIGTGMTWAEISLDEAFKLSQWLLEMGEEV